VGKHDNHDAKVKDDGQVPKDIVIPPRPRDEGGRHRKDDDDERDKEQDTP
jgi:hypothetical protein